MPEGGRFSTVAEAPNKERMRPATAGPRPTSPAEVLASPLNIFVIYDDRLVVVELFSGEVVLRDPRDIEYHGNVFDYLMRHALMGDDVLTFLARIEDEFMQQRD